LLSGVERRVHVEVDTCDPAHDSPQDTAHATAVNRASAKIANLKDNGEKDKRQT